MKFKLTNWKNWFDYMNIGFAYTKLIFEIVYLFIACILDLSDIVTVQLVFISNNLPATASVKQIQENSRQLTEHFMKITKLAKIIWKKRIKLEFPRYTTNKQTIINNIQYTKFSWYHPLFQEKERICLRYRLQNENKKLI